MWYFAWILGVLLACAMGVLAAVWFEFHKDGIMPDKDMKQHR